MASGWQDSVDPEKSQRLGLTAAGVHCVEVALLGPAAGTEEPQHGTKVQVSPHDAPNA